MRAVEWATREGVGEWGCGGRGGQMNEYRRIQGFDHRGERRLLPGCSAFPPYFQVLLAAQVRWSEASSDEASGRAESGSPNQALVGARQ